MEQRFYIATLEIVYHAAQALVLQQFDRLFLRPILPPEKTVHVALRWTDTLEIPPKPASAESQTLLAWRKTDGEQRLYRDGDRTPMLASRLSATGDQVQIDALQDEREQILKEFRPWFQIHLERLLLWNNALVLHSASIIYREEAILFTAPSGTGKTTQTDLWHQYREGVSDLNGDRTVLQWTERGWYGCGFPIYGGTVRCVQAAAPVRAIVVIRQAKEDTIRELSPMERVMYLYSECTVMRAYEEDIENVMSLLEEIAATVTVIELDCTMERSAVNVLHQYLYGE